MLTTKPLPRNSRKQTFKTLHKSPYSKNTKLKLTINSTHASHHTYIFIKSEHQRITHILEKHESDKQVNQTNMNSKTTDLHKKQIDLYKLQ